jgi:hypothetical protein
MNQTDRTNQNFESAIRELPNDREVILGAAERLGEKARNAGITHDDLVERMRGRSTSGSSSVSGGAGGSGSSAR